MPACRHLDRRPSQDQQDDQVEFDVRGDHPLQQHSRAAVHDPVLLRSVVDYQSNAFAVCLPV
jgi:hypothetical protein